MAEVKDLQFGNELEKILDIYTDDNFTQGDKEPLDSDEVENLLKLLRPQLELMNGNITEKEYNKQLEVRFIPKVQYFIIPITSINDSDVKFTLLRVDNNVRSKILDLRTNFIEHLDLPSASVPDETIEMNTVLIPGDLTGLSDEYVNLIQKLEKFYSDTSVVEITNEITILEFDNLYEHTNWNENTSTFITEKGFYFTNQFETDLIDSFMLDYSEVGIEEL